MTLAERLSEYVRAAFSGIWVQSHENDEAVREIAQLCRANAWSLASWDIDRGIALNGDSSGSAAVPAAADPLAAIRSLNALATHDGTALLVLRNFLLIPLFGETFDTRRVRLRPAGSGAIPSDTACR